MKKLIILLIACISITFYGCNEKTYNFDYITKEEIFSLEEEKFYAVFIKEKCDACKKIDTELQTFDTFLKSYPNNTIPRMYLIDCNNNPVSQGENSDLTTINNYNDLINEATIQTPTLIVVEKNCITNYFIGSTNISNFISLETTEISTKLILHNIDDPKEITIPLDFVPEKYSVIDENNKKSTFNISSSDYTEGKTGYSNGVMHFIKTAFNRYLPGKYTLKLFNDENEFETTLYITSILNYIYIADMFSQEEEKYYVFFLRDGCSGCNYAKPTLFEYSKNFSFYTNEAAYPLYAVHDSQHSEKISGSPANFIGVSDLKDLVFDAFPRVFLIENGVITQVYKNIVQDDEESIVEHFKSIMN